MCVYGPMASEEGLMEMHHISGVLVLLNEMQTMLPSSEQKLRTYILANPKRLLR